MNLYAGYHPSASVTPLDRVPVTIDPQTFHERYVLARRPCVVVGLPSPSIDPHFQLDTSIMSMRPTTGGDAIARQEPPRKRQRHKYDNDAVPQSLSLIDHWLSSNPAFANAVVQVEQRSMRTGTFGTADRAKLRMTVGDLVQRLREGVHATMGDGDATNDDAPYYLTTQYVDEENGRDVSRALAAVDEFVLRGRELNSRVCGNGAAVKGDNGDHNNDHKSRRPSRQARDSNTGTMDETMDDDDELKHRLLDLWPPPILQALREVLPLRPHLLRELVPQQINLWLGASR